MCKKKGDVKIEMPNPSNGSLSLDKFNELGDSSGPLFSIYSKTEEEHDIKRAERHQKDAEGIVIFTGLFSAALAALITVSIQDIRPGPQDKSDFYLENIFQLLADPNVSRASISSTLPKPPPFSPPRYAIWVNLLWFSSLAISITGALLATLIQQWTRRYLEITQPPGSPRKRARIREHVFSGPHILHFLWASDAVPTLLHLSVFLFFAGLLVLLRNTDHTIFSAVAVWVVLCATVYTYITFLPIFRPTSPHYAPLSSLVWHIYTYVILLFKKLREKTDRGDRSPAYFVKRLKKEIKQYIDKKELEPKLDAQVLESFFETVGDCAQECQEKTSRYFEAILGFCNSGPGIVKIQKVKTHLTEKFRCKFSHTVVQFLDRTLSSHSISESIRTHRLLTCLKATHAVLGDNQSVDAGKTATDRIALSRNWDAVLPSLEIKAILKNWHDSKDELIAAMGIHIIARIIASAGKDSVTSKALITVMFPLWETDMSLTGVDWENQHNVFLANLIYTTRKFSRKKFRFQNTLQSISGFDVQKTDSKLQRAFCALWNEIVQDVGKQKSSNNHVSIPQEIIHVYNDLHPTSPIDVTASTSDMSSHPSCQCSRTQSYDSSLPTYSQQDTAPPINEHTTEHDAPHASSQQIAVVTATSSSL